MTCFWPKIQFHDEIQKAFTDALNYLSYRMRSESEIRLYLKKEGNGRADH
ncbi:hypothetical protein RCO48_05185 [Peribacillus frigoritolerans]|nr:hypothetical protein [Peribacillus frigoritolerans]